MEPLCCLRGGVLTEVQKHIAEQNKKSQLQEDAEVQGKRKFSNDIYGGGIRAQGNKEESSKYDVEHLL